MTALERIKELAQHATRWTVVVTRNNHRSFVTEEVSAEVVLAMVECIEAAKGAGHALRSYQYGNASTELAEQTANAIDAALSKLEQMK